MTEYRTEGEA